MGWREDGVNRKDSGNPKVDKEPNLAGEIDRHDRIKEQGDKAHRSSPERPDRGRYRIPDEDDRRHSHDEPKKGIISVWHLEQGDDEHYGRHKGNDAYEDVVWCIRNAASMAARGGSAQEFSKFFRTSR